MPIVAISTARLRGLLGTEIEGKDLAEAIDRLGCDLEELVEVHLFECPACGGSCTPERPLGAPMVSAEGACAAYYRYRRVG